MTTILNIMRLHITLQLQNKSTYLQSFVVPILMMFILGLAIGDPDTVLYLDVMDEDNSERSAELIEEIRGGDTAVEICLYGSDKNPEGCNLDPNADVTDVGADRIKESDTTAILIIPAGFGAALEAGQPVELTYQSADQFNAPTITRTAVETAISEVGGSLMIARIGVETAEAYFGESPDAQADLQNLQARAKAGLQNPAARLVAVSSSENDSRALGVSQSVPGMGTMFVLFSLTGLAINLVLEREQGTLQRLFTLPAPKSHVVIGKVLGAFFFGVIQFAVFIIVGLLMNVEWGSNYAAITLVVLAYCFAGTALGFAMATLVRTSNQAGGITTLMVLTLAPLGGAWWPLEIVPETMQKVGHISPIAWAMDGFGDIIYDDGGIIDVLPEVGVLLLMAVGLLTFAIWRFRYE